jgi:hypothetical protein
MYIGDSFIIYRGKEGQLISKCPFVPCPSTGSKMFCAGPNFLGQTKNCAKRFCDGTKTEFTKCKSSFGLAQKV